MEEKKEKKKIYFGFAVFVLAIFVYAIIGENGLLDHFKYKKERDRLGTQHQALLSENKEIAIEVELLKKNKRYIEKTAREELGMVGTNEVIYKVD